MRQITIKEDGVSKSESVDFINTQVAGGSADWMPEDEAQAGVFYVYANGEYVPSNYGLYGFFAVGVLVPGGNGAETIQQGSLAPTYVTPLPATGLGASLIGIDPIDNAMYRMEIQDVDGIPTLSKTKVADSKADYKPVAMKILIEPAKLLYKSGEKISYAGLVVQLLDSTGYTFVDERFPQGIISWSPVKNLLNDWLNLITPVENARHKDNITVVDTDVQAASLFVPFKESVTDFAKFDCGSGTYRYISVATDVPVYTAIILTRGNYEGGYIAHSVCASKEPFKKYVGGQSQSETDKKPSNPDLYYDAGELTFNGKTLYTSLSWYGLHDITNPTSTIPYSIIDKSGPLSSGDVNPIAYSMIYGTLESEMSVPVKWNSPYDNQTYEDTFEIEVKDA